MGWAVNATPRALYPRERPGTHCTGGWVGPRAGLDGCGKFRPIGIQSPDSPVRSESLYRLSYPALAVHSGTNYICFFHADGVSRRPTPRTRRARLCSQDTATLNQYRRAKPQRPADRPACLCAVPKLLLLEACGSETR